MPAQAFTSVYVQSSSTAKWTVRSTPVTEKSGIAKFISYVIFPVVAAFAALAMLNTVITTVARHPAALVPTSSSCPPNDAIVRHILFEDFVLNLWAESSETSHVAYSAECRDIPANSDEPLRFMKSGSNDKAKSASSKHYDMEELGRHNYKLIRHLMIQIVKSDEDRFPYCTSSGERHLE